MTTTIQAGFLKETIALRDTIEGAFIELAARLYKIREESLWQGEYEDFDDFLSAMRLSKATCSKLCTVYETFVVRHKLSQKKLASVGWSSLYAIASRADTKEKAVELVERAGLLTRHDLETSLKQDDHPSCKHAWESIHLRQCTTCGVRERVYEQKD